MNDWREHIVEQSEAASKPAVKGTDVEVGSVLRLIADGWTIDRVVSRFPNLTREDVSACLEYAVELLDRDALRAEMRRRIADAKAHPERGIPHEDVMRELFEGLPEDDE